MAYDAVDTNSRPLTHYEVLGVAPQAPQSRIHDAYAAALRAFRDTFEDDPEAQEKLDRVRLAYKVIGNKENRAAYNAKLALEAPPEQRYTPYLQEEEQSLEFWTGFAVTAFWFLFFGWWAFLLRGTIWLGGKAWAFVSGRSEERDKSSAS
jgi:curved DNA-binding protein CbpA